MSNAVLTQAQEALRYGNTLRLDGARWRRELHVLSASEGRLRLAEALEDPNGPVEIEAMRLPHFLTAARGLGVVLAFQIQVNAGVHRTIGRNGTGSPQPIKVRHLGVPERRRLAEELRRRARAGRS